MTVTRRRLLKGVAGAAVGIAAAPVEAAAPRYAPADAVAMLFDTTRCIGCKACVKACREANDLPNDPGPFESGLWDAPLELNSKTKNIIKLFKEDEETSFMKEQCMHCLDPACCGACMLGALQKREFGIVWWEGDKCVGCRYCQMACPYNIPKFEWESKNPRIVKCEFCRHLLADGGIPACCEACPREAVIFGKRDALLADAHGRLAAHPGKYTGKVYGEHDGGGTQVLYLSHVPFDKLGLPDLGEVSQAAVARTVQHSVYKWVLAPLLLFAFVGSAVQRNLRVEPRGKQEQES